MQAPHIQPYLEAALAAVDEINKQLPMADRIERGAHAHISGETSPLDSLAFLNFIMALEETLRTHLGLAANLTDPAVLEDIVQMETVGDLAAYLQKTYI